MFQSSRSGLYELKPRVFRKGFNFQDSFPDREKVQDQRDACIAK